MCSFPQQQFDSSHEPGYKQGHLMPRAEVAGDEKGSVSLKMAYLKGRIKDVPWDRYLPCYMKKNQSEIALTLYFKRELL